MPYRKRRRYKKKRSKRRYGKKRGRMSRISSIRIKSPSCLPDTTFVKLKYNGVVVMTNIAGYGSYRFAVNSLFDPDITSAGHQPMAYDQWANFYDHYEVMGSKIRVEVLAPSSVNSPTGFAMYPSKDSTSLTSFVAAREQPYSKSRWITGSNNKKTVCSNYITPRKLEGRTTSSVNFTAAVSSNPASLRYWHLVLETLDGSTIATTYCDVLITYYCKFFGRINLGTS